MSRKDYVAIARAIKDARIDPANSNSINGIKLINALTIYFGESNPRFDTKRFESAAWPED